MHRLARFDIGVYAGTPPLRLVLQLGFGASCAAVMIAMRELVNLWAPHSGPFAMVYPAVLLATLYGRWQAGIVTWIVTFMWTWHFVLLPGGTFEAAVAGDGSRILINAIASLIVLVFAETFRRAIRHAMAERDHEIAGRTILLEELEHRTKNDFALSVSLLENQRRRHSNPEVVETLSQAIERIRAFARAYTHVSETRRHEGAVEMQPYLEEAVGRMARAAFSDRIAVSVRADAMALPRDTAVAIGLFANEALTNCAKYAFPDDRAGTVQVDFSKRPGGWELAIRDDGVGVRNSFPGEGSTGIGNRLLSAFAKQAGASHVADEVSDGCHIRLISEPGGR